MRMHDYYCDYKIIYKINFIHMFLKSPTITIISFFKILETLFPDALH